MIDTIEIQAFIQAVQSKIEHGTLEVWRTIDRTDDPGMLKEYCACFTTSPYTVGSYGTGDTAISAMLRAIAKYSERID